MMKATHLELLVEEPSVEAALEHLVPRIRPDVSFKVHTFNGKPDLLRKLPDRLRGYKAWLPPSSRIVVLVDEDREDCRKLKKKLDDMSIQAGLTPKAHAAHGLFHVLNRIVVEELEAWLLGDVPALAAAYPGVSVNLHSKRGFRDVDAIHGGTWEALERVLQQAGHFPGGLAKIQVAREVSAHMRPERNTSRSFQVFHDGLRML